MTKETPQVSPEDQYKTNEAKHAFQTAIDTSAAEQEKRKKPLIDRIIDRISRLIAPDEPA